MKQCDVAIYSDQTECRTCGAVWDTNDWDGKCPREESDYGLLKTTVLVVIAVNLFLLGFLLKGCIP